MINAMKEKMDDGKAKCVMELAKRKLELSHIKLEPLHKMLFKREIVQTHRALDDVMLTADVLFEITKKNFKKSNID
jgi:DNA polymerase III epsilon subunit-like protein